MQRAKVFVCYSHEDEKWFLKDLQKHLKPIEQKRQVEIWTYQSIQPGEVWSREIIHALQTTSIAVLLVSAHFFASDFIQQHELPILLAAAEQKKVKIIPVLISICDYKDSRIGDFQFVNDPRRPLDHMPKGEQGEVWLKVANSVKDALAMSYSISSPYQIREKMKIVEGAAYQGALREINLQTTDSAKRINNVLLLADMADNLNEVEKQYLLGYLHQLRIDEKSNIMQEYISLVLGLLGDVTASHDMRTAFIYLRETLPSPLQKQILARLAQQDNKSA